MENTYNFDSPQGIPLSGMMAPKVWVDAFRALPDWNWTALIMGCSGIAFLYIMKKMNSAFLPRIPLPNQLFLVIISTAVTYAFGLNESPYDLNILGHIQSGLPSFKVPSFPLGEESFSSLFGSALLKSVIAAIVYYIITVSIGKTFSARVSVYSASLPRSKNLAEVMQPPINQCSCDFVPHYSFYRTITQLIPIKNCWPWGVQTL